MHNAITHPLPKALLMNWGKKFYNDFHDEDSATRQFPDIIYLIMHIY